MMGTLGKKMLGAVIAALAAISLVITLYAVYQLWNVREPVTQNAVATLDLLTTTLDTTAATLATFDQSLDTTAANIDYLQRMSDTMAQALHDTTPVVDSLKSLTAKDLPASLQSTQKSLQSAQASAKLIDDLLGTLSKIPFLPVTPYKPDVPLSTSLGQVQTSLDALSPSLDKINSSLTSTGSNIAVMEVQTRDLGRNIQHIRTNIADLRKAATEYEETTATIRARVLTVRTALPTWINGAAVALTFVLIWLAIIQLDFVLKGLRLLM